MLSIIICLPHMRQAIAFFFFPAFLMRIGILEIIPASRLLWFRTNFLNLSRTNQAIPPLMFLVLHSTYWFEQVPQVCF
jgi:hypothetical protein